MSVFALLPRRLFMVCALVVLGGCASRPTTEAPPLAVTRAPTLMEVPETREPAPPKTSPAVMALLSEARSQGQQGKWERAAASLERALRIEPRNAELWHELGLVRLAQNRPEQAEAMATKSNSLAEKDTEMRWSNWRLIAAARRLLGDEAGAKAADRQAYDLARQE